MFSNNKSTVDNPWNPQSLLQNKMIRLITGLLLMFPSGEWFSLPRICEAFNFLFLRLSRRGRDPGKPLFLRRDVKRCSAHVNQQTSVAVISFCRPQWREASPQNYSLTTSGTCYCHLPAATGLAVRKRWPWRPASLCPTLAHHPSPLNEVWFLPVYERGNWGSEALNSLPQVTQAISGSPGSQTQVLLTPKLKNISLMLFLFLEI